MSGAEVEILRSRMAALEQLLEVHEQSVIEQSTRLEKALEELRRSNQELEMFAHLASHDLQEPLRAVAGYSELLVRGYAERLDEQGRQYLRGLTEGVRRMQGMIVDLLAYARVHSRGETFRETDSRAALEEALACLEAARRESGARVSYGSLPTVWADPRQLRQLFQNLLSNAMKFRGPDRPRIEIRAESRESEWVFQVSDNGIGIEPRYAEAVFEPFRRLHTRTEYPGTGIGLAVCRKIVQRHRGRIWVDSNPAGGSTFSFTLPGKP